MASVPTLVYCAGGNRLFQVIAREEGFANGARLPNTVYDPPLWFADQDWKKPDRGRYMQALAVHRPVMATVLDWERENQLPEVLSWAEEAAQHVERYVVIVPKVPGGVTRIPTEVGGKEVVLGYSVASKFGGTDVLAWELAGRRLHLLGGSPSNQLKAYLHLAAVCEVVSVDGNYSQMKAVKFCEFWNPTRTQGRSEWMSLSSVGDDRSEGAPYEAFRRSCEAIATSWRRLVS